MAICVLEVYTSSHYVKECNTRRFGYKQKLKLLQTWLSVYWRHTPPLIMSRNVAQVWLQTEAEATTNMALCVLEAYTSLCQGM